MIIVIGPWVYRNLATFNASVLVSTNGGEHLLVENNPNATGGHLSREELPKYARTVPFEQRVARQVERDREAGRIALAWIQENPAQFVMLMPRKVFWLWAPDGEGEWGFQAGYASYDRYWPVFRTLRYLNQGFYAVLLIFSMVATWSVFTRRFWSFALLQCLAVPIFLTLISMVFTGQSRYHFPAMPFLLILAAAGIRQSAFGQPSFDKASRMPVASDLVLSTPADQSDARSLVLDRPWPARLDSADPVGGAPRARAGGRPRRRTTFVVGVRAEAEAT